MKVCVSVATENCSLVMNDIKQGDTSCCPAVVPITCAFETYVNLSDIETVIAIWVRSADHGT